MKKETFHKKGYFPLLLAIFFGSLIVLMYPGIWAILYEDDMPFMGVVWIGVLVILYWFIKRIFYNRMFGDRIFPRRNKQR